MHSDTKSMARGIVKLISSVEITQKTAQEMKAYQSIVSVLAWLGLTRSSSNDGIDKLICCQGAFIDRRLVN